MISKGCQGKESTHAETVSNVKNHPLLAQSIPVHGLVMDPETGKVDVIVNGYENVK